MAGIDKDVGYRFLRDRYLEIRRSGLTTAAATNALGFTSSRVATWEALVDHDHRHHLRVDVSREAAFWLAFNAGASLTSSAVAADVGSATAYRWVQRRFHELRSEGHNGARIARQLRLSARRAAALEQQRAQRKQRDVRRPGRGCSIGRWKRTTPPFPTERQRPCTLLSTVRSLGSPA